MRVLITGGAGRLGTGICRTFLNNGFVVRAFDLDTPRNRRSLKGLKNIKGLGGRLEVHWGDVTRRDPVRRALGGVDAVVHMAAVLPPLSDLRPELAFRVNVGGTRTLTELLKEAGRPLPFVYTSSVAVFGPRPGATAPLDADRDAPRPAGPYAESKFQAENLVRESGIPYVILRLTATIYLSFAMSDLKRMFSVPLENRVEFCHPGDAALAVLNAVRRFEAVKGNTLVISGGPDQRMLYRDMVAAILGVLGLPLPPARKFTHKPYYLGWYDTAKSQRLLTFQRRTFADYLEDYSDELARRFSRGFLPFMRGFVSPVWGRLIVEFM